MRDRRNTNMSVSSTDSTQSTPASRSTRDSMTEKRHSSPPPPSPTLPAPVTREHYRSRPQTRRRMLLKVMVAICAVVALGRYISNYWTVTSMGLSELGEHGTPQTELVAGNHLPDEPTALVVADPTGTSRWTISIPHNWTFPLPGRYYKDMCAHGATLRNGIGDGARHGGSRAWWHTSGHFAQDPTYLDVQEAEAVGALPESKVDASNVCESSLTFVLEADQASFGQSLLLLWLSYGLAKKEGRAFFLDDSRWAWGRYATYFQPPPKPTCHPPAAHHIVPCPMNAKHLLVASTTATWTFGAAFQRAFQVGHRHGVASQHGIFKLLRTGYDDLFHLTAEDASYATSRIAKFKHDASKSHSPLIGMQIRRGDMHPFEYQYSRDYLPLERFARAAQTLLQTTLGSKTSLSKSDEQASLILASDDPDITDNVELQQAILPLRLHKAQNRIQLATKAALDRASPVHSLREPHSPYVKHVDENSGWEGGFYAATFFALGGAKAGERRAVAEHALRLRELVGRAYLLDLTVLGASDGVVCAVSSATCRVIAVVMGWEAVREGRWVNVDDRRAWSWNGRR